jgi:hypothetical protein
VMAPSTLGTFLRSFIFGPVGEPGAAQRMTRSPWNFVAASLRDHMVRR